MFYCWVFFINILDSQTRLLEKNAKDRPLEPVGRSTSSESKTVKLTTRGRFAVTSMIDLSLHSENGPVRLADIAKRQKISLPYLEQIFGKLRRAELVKSVRGPGGGYRLGRDASEISAGEIVEAVEGIMDVSQCQGGAACRGGAQCLAHGLWADLNAKMAEFLNAQSLQSIKEKSLKEHAHHGEVREQPITVHITEPKS